MRAKRRKRGVRARIVALVAALCVCGVIAGFSIVTVFRMNSQISDLQADYNNLEAQNEQNRNSLQSLQSSYSTLNSNYNQISSQYNDLQISYQVSEALGIGHLLADYYDEVRDLHTEWGWRWYGNEQDVIGAVNLAKHVLGRIYWPSLKDTYYEFANEYSSTTATRELNEVYNLMGIQSGDSSVEKIRKILSFVDNYIHYESDYNNAFLAPVETLAFKSGDCDDFSILVAALFEKAGIDSAIGLFRSEDRGHAMVLVHLDDIHPYLSYHYSDLTDKGLAAGTWVVIEPQFTIEQQASASIGQWGLRAAAEV